MIKQLDFQDRCNNLAFIIIIRLLATRYRWSLPKVDLSRREIGGDNKEE